MLFCCKTIDGHTTISALQTKLKQVKNLYDEFGVIQTAIEEACNSEDNLRIEFVTRGQVDDFYFFCVSELQEAINAKNVVQQVVQPNANNRNASQDIKLPKVELTAFSGEYEDWPSFKDLYNTLIHNNASLSSVQKLHYLRTNVKGGAYDLIKTISITEANYAQAWKKLTDRYDHKRYIVDSHLKTLLNQPQVTFEDHKAIKTLIDKSSEIVRALQVQGLPVNQWDAFLVHIVVSKLDSESHKQWELKLKKDELPKFAELEEFLESRWQSLEMIDKSMQSSTQTNQSAPFKQSSNRVYQKAYQIKNTSQTSSNINLCIYCNTSGHMTGFCPEYISLSHDSKTNFVKSKKLCFNCLKPNHSLASCTNKSSCQQCGKRHHTSLHTAKRSHETEGSSQSSQAKQPNQQSEPRKSHAVTSSSTKEKQVLLATAIVNVKTASGLKIPARALIDKGGDHSIIQEKLAKQLGIIQQKEPVSIVGVGETIAQAETSLIKIEIESCIDTSFKLEVDAYTMKSITGNLPGIQIERKRWPHLQGVKLADNQFENSAPIQLLLGAEVYEEILLNGIIKKEDNSPTAVNSRLGWLLFGKVLAKVHSRPSVNIFHTSVKNEKLDEALRSFWELEEIPLVRKFTVKEQQAEDIFQQSKFRNEQGRYVVALPFDPSKASEELGESRSIALHCLYRLEKRFQSNPTVKERYIKYIQNLIEANHIELVPQNRLNIADQEKFYLPHHPVMKESSLTTKLRVVFNASQKSKSGISLNEKLLIGPKIQDDLFDILIRWRKHKIVFIADVEKMYRQVKLIENHRDYQRFLWRFSKKDTISEYRITTVIDGTASAQFLATRALRQLAVDSSTQYPEAAETILKDFYVDDVSSGSHGIQSALKLQMDLIELLKQGGFMLKKWFSNSQELMDNVPEENRHNLEELVELIEKGVKTLGVFWNQKTDCFNFKVSSVKIKDQTNKRKIMSDVCKLFDPIGWLSPTTVVAKIFLQSLWSLKDIGWDDKLPDHKIDEWQKYRQQLSMVEKIQIPRWIHTGPAIKVEFHGFADASNLAYAAVIYTRIVLADGSIHVYLICSKTKVAPLKTITTPKLELCGCVLLANRIKKAFDFEATETFLYSDSTTALAWITSHPNHWNIFVANRITEIQQITDTKSWRFIETTQNPADCASRGVNPEDLKNHPLWWHGPAWLQKDQTEWPKQKCEKFETDLEKRKVIRIMHSLKPMEIDHMYSIIREHSDLFRLQRRIVFLLRWRKKVNERDEIPKANELRYALNALIKFTQNSVFKEEVVCCTHNEELPRKSKLISLIILIITN